MARNLWVLIAAAGKPTLLLRTLASLAATAKPSSYRGTLVVENGSPCGIEEAVRGFDREHGFRYLHVREANKSHALNYAVKTIDDGLVFMTDDDVRLDPHVLVAYHIAAEYAESSEFYGGPVLIDAEHGLPPVWMRRFYALTIAEPWRLPFDACTKLANQHFMGTNWAAFASDLIAAGGFDTRLGPGGTTGAAGQETEAQRRLLALSVAPVYIPDAVVWHYLHREFLEPEWVLRRTYRHGLEWGIRRMRGGKSNRLLLIRGAIGRLNAHAKGLALRLAGGEQRRFEAAFHESKWRGRWEGLWLGRRWDELPKLPSCGSQSQQSRAA